MDMKKAACYSCFDQQKILSFSSILAAAILPSCASFLQAVHKFRFIAVSGLLHGQFPLFAVFIHGLRYRTPCNSVWISCCILRVGTGKGNCISAIPPFGSTRRVCPFPHFFWPRGRVAARSLLRMLSLSYVYYSIFIPKCKAVYSSQLVFAGFSPLCGKRS